MTTIVGVFDSARDLDKAVTRLAEAGFRDTVYDDGIIADEGFAGAAAFVPHLGQAVTWNTAEPDRKPRKPNQAEIVRAFKEHLSEHHLSDDIIEGYAVTFRHDGKFALVKTRAKEADLAMKIMNECGASRVNRHG
jgi:hypothetical protein